MKKKKKIKLNGKDYEWKNITVTIMGVEVKGITEIEYTPSIVDFELYLGCKSYLLNDINQQ